MSVRFTGRRQRRWRRVISRDHGAHDTGTRAIRLRVASAGEAHGGRQV